MFCEGFSTFFVTFVSIDEIERSVPSAENQHRGGLYNFTRRSITNRRERLKFVLFQLSVWFGDGDDKTRRPKIMSKETNLIDFLHDHYANTSTTDVSQTLLRLRQQLDQQRKLVLNEIASVQREEELVKTRVQNPPHPSQKPLVHEKRDSLTSIDVEQINKMPLDL